MNVTTTAGTAAEGRADEWLGRSACRDVDGDLFFPAGDSGPKYEAQVAAAKTVCARCEVRGECLGWALDALPFGVAGGMTEQERSEERTRRRGPRRKCRVPRPPVRGSLAETAAAGRDAIRAGCPTRQVGREFGVTERTAERWARCVRAEATGNADTLSHGAGTGAA